jgi:hypothetical protein
MGAMEKEKDEIQVRREAIKEIQKGYVKQKGFKAWKPAPRQSGRAGK